MFRDNTQSKVEEIDMEDAENALGFKSGSGFFFRSGSAVFLVLASK